MIAKSRLKLLIALGLALAIFGGVLGAIMGLGRLVTYFNRGADRAAIFQVVPTIPVDLEDRVLWLPDLPSAGEGRVMEPYTRDKIAGAYLLSWAQLEISYELGKPYGLKTYFGSPALEAMQTTITTTIAAGWQVRQANLHHSLTLAFYSDDGSIVAFTDRSAHVVQQVQAPGQQRMSIIESTSRYDVVMRLEDGNWRVRDRVRRGEGLPLNRGPTTAFALGESEEATSTTEFVQVRGNQLYFGGEPFMVAGVNYYPQASPWTKFWPEYSPEQSAVDLDAVKQLGLNTVRIFVSYTDFGADKVSQLERAKLTHFLDAAAARGLKVIVTLFDHHTDHSIQVWAADDRHLHGLIPYFADHPAILAWDIKNEADRDYAFNTQPLVDAWLRHIAGMVRADDPNHLITIGWSNPEAAMNLTAIVDFVSYHYFEQLADYTPRLEHLIASTAKPVLLQEFVMSTWNSFWPHGHSEAEQAYYYATLLQQHRRLPTAGYLVWTLRDFDTIPLAEFSTPWQRATQAHMGLYRHDGTMKPAAQLIAPGASLAYPPLPWWQRWVKPLWLLLYGIGMGVAVVGVLLYRRFAGQ